MVRHSDAAAHLVHKAAGQKIVFAPNAPSENGQGKPPSRVNVSRPFRGGEDAVSMLGSWPSRDTKSETASTVDELVEPPKARDAGGSQPDVRCGTGGCPSE